MLAIRSSALCATPKDMLPRIATVEDALLAAGDQIELPTEHVIHAGMYARTVIMPQGMVMTGALIKRATTVIVCGAAAVLVGEEWQELDGYYVLPASSGRKQVFVSRSPVIITMIFPTQARTVEEAEAEFTDDCERLLSRKQQNNTVLITEE